MNANGSVVATSTIGNNQLQNSSVTINSTSVALGGSATITAASSTLLSNNNTFSGTNIFSNGLTVNSGLTLGTALSIGNGGSNAISYTQGQLLSFNGTSFVSTSTIGNNQLANSTISGVSLGGTLANLSAGTGLSGSAYNGSGTQTFSLNLANANNWTALQTFTNATSTLFSAGTIWDTGVTNGVLSTNAQGQVVATTSIGTNYLTGNLGSINGTPFNVGIFHHCWLRLDDSLGK